MREQEIHDIPATAASRQDTEPTATLSPPAPAAKDEWQRWCWLRHWEFWLALALGAFLRLWQLGTTQFLDDQTGLYTLARTGALHHALPLTGITSSIGTLNPPLSVYLLLPFAAITANPLPAVVALALWNVLGVALCYIFGLRYFGRRIAAIGTLLFATGGSALNYSRFLWQQNYLAPLLVLWALTLYMGAVRGERRWLAGNIVLLCLAVQLHATAVLLAPVTLVAVLLAPRLPRLRAYVVAAIGVLLLFVPTLLFEAVSQGYDLHKLAHYVLHGGRFDTQVINIIWQALDGPGSADLGPVTPYSAPHRWYFFFTWGVVLLVVSGWLVLTARVFAPALALWHERMPETEDLPRRLRAWGIAVWLGLHTNPTWRSQFLLWFWVTFPLATMVHHSGNLFGHYLLIIFPAIFLVGGFGVDWLITRFTNFATSAAPLRRRAVPALALVFVAFVVVGQGLRMFLYPTAIATGNFEAYISASYPSYGYPLDELNTLNDQLTALQSQQGTTATFVITRELARYSMPETYILAADRTDRVALPSSCLALPAPDAGAALAVSLAPGSPAETLLASLPNAHVVAHVPLAGGDPLAVYYVSGTTPMLADDAPVQGVTYLNGSGDGLRLDAVSSAIPGSLRLRWTILGAPPAGPGSPFYHIQIHVPGTANTAAGRMDCVASQLHAGETLFTWITLPAQLAPSGTDLASGTAIQVSAGTQALDEFSVGPFRFLTDRSGGAPLTPLTLTPSPAAAP